MAIRTRSVPDKTGRDETVESVDRLDIDDPKLHPHVERIFIDSNHNVAFELYRGNENAFVVVAMYRDGDMVPEVQADQMWVDETLLVVGRVLTLRFDLPMLDHYIWPIERIEVSRGRGYRHTDRRRH